jgi:sigma-B regulation protein RsbU (phosphoserine phosphatase)
MNQKLERLSERLQLNKFKLQTLLDITKGINDNLPISQLVAIYRGIVEGELGLSQLLLYSKSDTDWEVLLQYGDDRSFESDLAQIDLSGFEDISVISNLDEQPIAGFDILIPVQHDGKALAYLFIGDIDESISISPIIKHMNFIQTITNILVVAIENKRLMRESIRQERMRRELELAAEMQAMLVPGSFVKNDILDVHALYYPHAEVGGDYYDQFGLKNGKQLICIADVSGKGIAAAFLMANFQASLHVLAEVEDSLESLVHSLNKSVVDATKGDRFITFFIGIYDPTTRMLDYVNAGHNPPLLYDGAENWLRKGCMGLGMVDDIPAVNSGHINVKPSAILTCFTDGLVEVENDQGEEYGEARVSLALTSHKSADMSTLNTELRQDFDSFRGSNPPHDDFALLSVRFF